MNALNKISWRTMFTIFFVLVAIDALNHILTHTPITNIGFISWK
jgi:hypothetical protein